MWLRIELHKAPKIYFWVVDPFSPMMTSPRHTTRFGTRPRRHKAYPDCDHSFSSQKFYESNCASTLM